MKKLFSIFFALALLLPVSTQAQRTQHVSRTSRIEKSPMVINNIKGNNNAINTIQLSGVSAQKETSQANSGTPAPRQNAPGKDVSPIKRAFPSFNSFQQTDGYDEGQTFSWSNTTVTRSGSQFIVSAVEDQSSYVIQSEVYLYTDGTTNYLPSGDYALSTSLSEWTLGASTALNAIRTYGGYVDWYDNGVFYIYCIGRDAFALVHNPNHATKPIYLLMVGEDMTYNYYWTTEIGTEPNKRTVTFTWGNNGTDDGNDYEADIDGYICSASGDSYTVYEQTVITLTPQPKAGWHFDHWTGTNVGDITSNGDGTYRLQVGSKDYAIAAVFEQDPGGAITGVASPAAYGSVTVSPSGTQPAGTSVRLTPIANPGYAFIGWADGGNANPRDVTVSGDATYTANFAPTHTITVTASPAGYGTVSGGGTYGEGASVTLTATANSGYQFTQWNDGNSDNPRTVTMGNTDVTYTATFAVKLHDFEYHFTYEHDFAASASGVATSGNDGNYYNPKKYYSLRLQMLKNYVDNSVVAYPAMAIEIVTTQTSNQSGGYKKYNNKEFPYPATFTSTTSTINYDNRGKIVTSANSNQNFTKFYDSEGNTYIFSSGKIVYMAPVAGQTYPFVHVDGTFSGNKTVWVTIGTAPTYTITLNNQSATTGGTASVTATYTENTNLTSAITKPVKTGYTFGGYYTSQNGGGTQIIDADGNFKASVSGYTDALKRWLKAEGVTLYAKWTANTYTITLNNQSATTPGTASVSATFNASTNLTSAITKPTKTGLNFGGYYTGTDGSGVQIIDANGNFIASAGGNSTYLDGSRKWKYANNIELYARWYATSRITIKEYTGGTVTVYYNYSGAYTSGSSFNSGYRDIEVGTNITITASNAAHYTLTSLYYEGAGGYISSGAEHEVEGNAYIEAVFTGDSYSITYRDQNSDNTFSGTQTDAPTTHTYGTATTLKIPTREGYTFGGWFTAKNCASGAVGNTTAASLGATDYTGNITLYAKWTAITYAVTYNKGANGTGTIAAGEKTYGVDFTLSSSTFTREGYTQTGWSTSDGGAKDYNLGGSYTTDAVITLYPFWSLNTHTLTWDANGGSLTGGTAAGTTNYGAALTAPTGSKTGYTLSGWDPEVPATMPDADATYTAQWTANTYQVSFGKGEGSGAAMANQTFTYDEAQNLTANTYTGPAATISYDYNGATGGASPASATVNATFTQWTGTGGPYTDGQNVNNLTATNNDVVALTAMWEFTYEDATVTLPSPTKTGYTFDYWEQHTGMGVFEVGGAGEELFVDEDIAIIAHWTLNSHLLTWNANGGSLEGGTAAGMTSYGTTLTAPTATRTGYTFNGWSPSVPATMPDADATYTAQWNTVTYNLTYNGLESATHSNPATYTIETATITLTAPSARDGYTFTGWTCGGSPITQIAVGSTGNKTITANWEVAQRTVTIGDHAGGTITVTDGETTITTGSQAYAPSSTITLTATPDEDFAFVRWIDGTPALTSETTVDGVRSGTFILTDNVTVRAVFRRVHYGALTLKDGVTVGQTDIDFDDFSATYNDVTVDEVTYIRNNEETWGTNWSTLCLPFDVNEDNMDWNEMVYRTVYEFRYAEGNADAGIDLHFYPVRTMTAGVGYLVKKSDGFNSTMTFENVRINTSADRASFYDLAHTNKTQGSISLVGTLRNYKLDKTEITDAGRNYKSFMALSGEKIYYPGKNTRVPAYRAFFYDESPASVAPRVRIVVEDEQATPVEVIEMDGEGNLMPVSGEEVRKYIEDGVLIIERNGKRYTAQGAEL